MHHKLSPKVDNPNKSSYLDRSAKTLRVMMNEEVRRIMTKDPMTVSPEDSVSSVVEQMLQNHVMQVPVVDGKEFVGLLTTHDLWKSSLGQSSSGEQKVKDVMNTKVIKITPKDKVGTAAELFMDKRFKTLPVVNLRNELKGVVTSFDVLKQALKEEYDHPILYKEVFTD